MRRFLTPLWVLAVVVASLSFAAAPCLAEEPGAAPEKHESVNPVQPDLVVALATVGVFLVLFLVLSKTAWKPILAGLKAREDGIRASIEGAEKANADANALLADYQARLATATDEARSIVEEGRKDAEALRAKIEAEAVADAARERDRAIRDIEIAKDGALKEIYDRVAVIATDVAGKILQQKLDPAGHRRLVDEAVVSYERSRKAPGGRS